MSPADKKTETSAITGAPQDRSALTALACRATRTTLVLALADAAVVLQGCSMFHSSWIEAPLIADGYRDSAAYTPYDTKLIVNKAATTHLKFSYATLPKGLLSEVAVSTAPLTASLGQQNYKLDKSKIVSARLVLYVDKVITPGYIQVVDYGQDGATCFASESTPPNCRQPATRDTAKNADNTSANLRITEPGFYSFDVTAQVKNRIASDGTVALSVVAQPNGDTAGSFEFASKEQPTGQPYVLHQPQLFITLKDTLGNVTNARATTSVRESEPSSDFSRKPDLWLSGKPSERAYALIQAPTLSTGIFGKVRDAMYVNGSFAMKQSAVAFLNASVSDQNKTPR